MKFPWQRSSAPETTAEAATTTESGATTGKGLGQIMRGGLWGGRVSSRSKGR